MSYSEKPKVSWGAIVVVLAVMLFACIVVGALVIPKLLNQTNDPVSGNEVIGTSTPTAPTNALAI